MHRVVINADLGSQTISRHIYGHFAEHLGRCIYEGLWVGEDSPIPNTRGFRNDIVTALRELNIPNLRWPGGCFADTYHWKDGVGPREQRPGIVNVHWGGVTENNHCGTNEFLDLCAQLSSENSVCEPYIAGNVGSGTVREMNEWLDYLTNPGESPMATLRRKNGREDAWDVTFWGVGNEGWGCGGNMRPEYYADLYRQFSTYCHSFTQGKKLYKVACGQGDKWNEVLMREAGWAMDGLSVHYYTLVVQLDKKASATDFNTDDWYMTMQVASNIEAFVRRTCAIMDQYDPKKRVGMVMDEWGTWFNVEPGTNPGFLYQQNTIRDALVAGLSLNVLNNHADRVHVANIAQMINVLQAMALTDGGKMLLTPTYHVFEMYKVHQGATLLPTNVSSLVLVASRPGTGSPANPEVHDLEETLQISVSASRDAAGRIHVSLCNLHPDEAAEVAIDLRGVSASQVSGRILTALAMNAMNTFESPRNVEPQAFDDAKLSGQGLTVALPAHSVVVLELTV